MGRVAPFRAAVLAVLVAAVVPYLGALRAGFVYDDHGTIVEAPLIHSLKHVPALLTRDTWLGATGAPSGLYRPLTSLSFAVQWAIAGPRPLTFHAVNVLLHAGVCLLLLRVLRRFGAADPAAVAAALLFAVHPLHTEAVSWIVGRAELIGALFFLAAWAAHLRRDDADPGTGLAVGGCYLLAMTGKESAATLPIVLLISDALRRSAAGGSGAAVVRAGVKDTARARDEARRDLRWWAVRYGPSAGALALFVAARWSAVGRWTPPEILPLLNPLAPLALVERLAGAAHVLGRYLMLMLWPATLSADYSVRAFDVATSFADPRALVPALAILGMIAGGVLLRRRRPVVALGLLLTPAAFLLTSNVLFPIGTIMGERLAYLPSAGVCILAGSLLAASPGIVARLRTCREPAAAERSPRAGGAAREDRGRRALLGLHPVVASTLAVVLLAGAARTWARTLEWVDDERLLSATVRAVPDSWYANFALAAARLRARDDAGALGPLRACLRIHPASAEIRNDIGDVLRRRGDLDGAEAMFREELAVNPRSSKAPFNLGLLALARGRLAEAKESFALATRQNPLNADAHYNLALILAGEGDAASAREHLEAARSASPRNADVVYALGTLAASGADRAGARRLFEEAVALKPDHGSALYGLGVLELQEGRSGRARALFEDVLRHDPGAADARANLAAACLSLGDLPCARDAARRAAAAGVALPPELATLLSK